MNRLLLVWVFILLDIFLFTMIYNTSLYEYLAKDTSNISLLIIGLYFSANFAMLGIVLFPGNIYLPRLLEWSTSTFVSLGILGTVTGIILLFANLFTGVSFDSTDDLQKVLAQASNGFSIMATTTAVGLMAMTLLTFKRVWFRVKLF